MNLILFSIKNVELVLFSSIGLDFCLFSQSPRGCEVYKTDLRGKGAVRLILIFSLTYS